MNTKKDWTLIRVTKETHEILRREAVRQSMKPNTAISIGEVVAQYAKKLNKKHKFIDRRK